MRLIADVAPRLHGGRGARQHLAPALAASGMRRSQGLRPAQPLHAAQHLRLHAAGCPGCGRGAKGRRERAWARRGTTSAGCSLQIAAAARRVPQTLDRGLAETARVAVVAICSAPGAHKRVWGALAFPSSGTVQLHPAPQLSRRSKATGQSAGARGGLLGRPARWARQPSRAAFERASLQAAPRLPRCPPTAAAIAAAAACRADCWVDQHTSQPRCIEL